MSTILSSNRSKAYALLLINTCIWGFSAPIIKQSLNFVSPNEFLLARFFIASILFLPIFHLTSKPKFSNNWWLLIILAFLGTPLTLIPLYLGLTMTSSLEASILVATGPIITILGGVIFLREKVNKLEKVGLALAILGTLILIFGPLTIISLTLSGPSIIGSLLITLSNFIWTAFCLISKKFKTNANTLSLVSYAIGLISFVVLVYAEGGSITQLGAKLISSPPALLGVAFQAILGSIVAFWAYVKAQEYIEASEATVFTYLQPVFAFPLAFFWLHEPITVPLVISSLIITLGVFLSERHK